MVELKPKFDALAEQQEAIRDILFLYWGLTDFCGISGDDHLGSFDPWKWLQCEADYDGGVWRSYDDALLLREGSAVWLLSGFVGGGERGPPPQPVGEGALPGGRVDSLSP